MSRRPHSAVEIAEAVRRGELAWSAAAEASLEALDGEQTTLHTMITMADTVPHTPPADVDVSGPLAGVPVLVKDIIDTARLRTTCGSSIFSHRVPLESAECVRRLEAAGAVVVGKANLHEFAWGLTSRNPTWGDVGNPRDQRRTPGGSSGGNAAAVASGAVPLGIGTDTGGSIRVPAACCEAVGFKPSNGAVPVDGVFPLAPSLDCVGPLAAKVADCALAFGVLSGRPVQEVDVAGLTVAASEPALVRMLADVGVQAKLVHIPQPPVQAEVILPAEARRTHRELLRRHADKYDPNVLAKLGSAAVLSETRYRFALDAVATWRQAVAVASCYDVIVLPTLDIDVPLADVDELAVRADFGRATRWVNLLGWAAAAVGTVQVVGPNDATVLAVAAVIEPSVGLPPPG